MGKRIIIRPTASKPAPKRITLPPGTPWEPGQERRADPRRSGLPRRLTPDRRGGHVAPAPGDRRSNLRRALADRRRHRDRRFGLDPTLYDRLVELDL